MARRKPQILKSKMWYSDQYSDEDLELAVTAIDMEDASFVIRHALKLGTIKLQKAEIRLTKSARRATKGRIWHPTPTALDSLATCARLLGTRNQSLIIRYVLSQYVIWLNESYGGLK